MIRDGKRWVKDESEFRNTPKVDKFIEEVIAVCRKYGLSISQEDGHGSFLIEGTEYDYNYDWLRSASLVEGKLEKEGKME